MSRINRKILNTLLAIDIGIIIFCMLSGHRSWFYTTQIGFFSSALVIAASMASYRRMIEKRLEHTSDRAQMDERDTLDKLEDPHDLYSETVREEPADLTENREDETAEAEEPEQKSKRRSLREVLRDSRASLSFYRIGAYVLLVLGFFFLNRHGYLHLPSYLFSLSVPPVVVVLILLMEGRRSGVTEKGVHDDT